MRRRVVVIGLIFLSLLLSGSAAFQYPRQVRVGLYDNPPKIYTDRSGNAAGFWPVLMQAIANKEGWNIVWVHGTWDESLTRLKNNEIDIMPDVSFTEARSQIYTFSDETVLVSWSRVYVPHGTHIETILDLQGKKVGGLKDSVNFDGAEGIKDLTAKFQVNCTFISYNSYYEVFNALQSREIDAGVTNKDFGDLNENSYDVDRTPIMLQPSSLRFAFTQNALYTANLVSTIDADLVEMKADSHSTYYTAMDEYLGQKPQETIVRVVPTWVYLLLGNGAGALFLMGVMIVLARRQIKRQTAELRASESRYRALVENNPDLIFRLSGDGDFVDYHASVEDQLAASPQSFLGKNVKDVLPADLAKVTMQNVKKAIDTGKVQLYEYRLPIQEKMGEFEARCAASGKNEVIVIIRNITDRKQAERELRESEERYQTLAMVSPVGIFTTDETGSTNYVNPTWCQISGMVAEQALGDGWLSAVHPDDREQLQTHWLEAAHNHTVSRADYRFIRPDGSTIWVIGQAVPKMDANNEIVGFVGTITDITDRKKVEAALQRSILSERAALITAKTIQAANLALSRSLDLDEILLVLVDHLHQIVPYDGASVILLENRRRSTVYTYGNQGERHSLKRLDQLFDIDSTPILRKVIDEAQCIYIENTNSDPAWVFPFCDDKCVSWMGVPLIAAGQIVGLYSLYKKTSGFFTRDYAELAEAFAAQAAIAIQNARLHKALQRHSTELEKLVSERTSELAKRVSEVESLNATLSSLTENLKAAVIKAESADRLKSAFLATMSHELRTPLNSIIGFTGILLQKLVGPLSPEQEKQLQMVQGSARHLLELINDVLDISKIEAGQAKIYIETFDMGASIRKSIEKVSPQAEKKNLALITSTTPEVIEISSDRRRVEQVLINLLSNAVKFTDTGSIRLECSVRGDWVITRIIDTGVGIKPENREILFKPFQQVDSGISRQYEGTGLGLSICKRLVEMLGGEIWVESEWGKGSTFAFSLPNKR